METLEQLIATMDAARDKAFASTCAVLDGSDTQAVFSQAIADQKAYTEALNAVEVLLGLPL